MSMGPEDGVHLCDFIARLLSGVYLLQILLAHVCVLVLVRAGTHLACRVPHLNPFLSHMRDERGNPGATFAKAT